MKHIIISTFLILTTTIPLGQGVVKIGDKAPKYNYCQTTTIYLVCPRLFL